MPGIHGIINKNIFDKFVYIDEKVKVIETNDILLINNCLNKFIEDKVFFEDENYIIGIDGVILNSKELINKYCTTSLEKTIEILYESFGELFPNNLRGPFSGVLHDKKSKKTIIFTNHHGDKAVFYANINDTLVFSYDIKFIIRLFKENNVKYSLDESSAYDLVTYGFMIENKTLVNEIKRVLPGTILLANNNKIETKEYYRISNDIKLFGDEQKIINQLDESFRYAVNLCMEKDEQYGYEHLIGLSGGLDSRMTTWVANDLGYKNVTNYTFSKSNYLDFEIAQDIATDLKNEFVFKNLDDLKYINHIPNVIENNGGTGCASGHIHGKSMLDMINFNRYGLIHTGQLGDVVIGTFFSEGKKKPAQKGMGAYSNKLIHKVHDDNLSRYDNEELFKIYNRGLNGALNSHLTMQNYSEVVSPFMFKEFFDLCLSIDPKIKYKHNIYYKWILSKYPEAAKYKYEKIKTTFNGLIYRNKFLYNSIIKVPNKIGNKVNSVKYTIGLSQSKAIKNDMNPFQYWYDTNFEMKETINEYFINNINRLEFSKELFKDLKWMYDNCEAREKIQIITLLIAYRDLF